MDRTEMFKAFDMEDIERHKREYAEEARQKYGHTDAYRESMKRTEKYTKEDWAKISERQNAIYKRIADSMEKGPSAPEVQKAVGDWRQLISDSFYDCTLEIFKGLGELYVSDERFTKNLDKVKPGFAEFTSQAIAIYCADARD